MRIVGVIGRFENHTNQLSGQIVKTKIIIEELERVFGKERVRRFDTRGGLKTLLKAPRIVNRAFYSSANVIIMPAQNGLRVFAPLCAYWKSKRPKTKLFYIVIGGWLPEFLDRHRFLEKPLKTFDGIYVETSTMKKALEAKGYHNVAVMPNCKNLRILTEDELVYSTAEPLRLCTFSRVMKEKGIEDAVSAVKEINEQYGREVYQLDIFGQVDSNQGEWFDDLKSTFPSYVSYKGVVPYHASVDVIKDYFVLLFPTHFFTEGIPGTIIDAFAAGVPVISAKWENYGDILEDGVTGIGYEFDDYEGLKNTLRHLADQPEQIVLMKRNCTRKAQKYRPDAALSILLERLDG